jgi:hypothetical protein
MRRSGFIACLGCATGAVTLALVNADAPDAGGTIAAAQTITCRVTIASKQPAPSPAPPSFNYGNRVIRILLHPRNGKLIAGRLPGGGQIATINPDGSIGAKFGWWRAGSGKIRISGRRLDASAPPLRAHVPDGYGRGFQATGLIFPTTGCWKVTGRYLELQISFTLLVVKSRLGP